MVRAPCCEKMGLKKGPWTPEEDQILITYIQQYGHGNWRALPKQAGLLRCGKSCRLRWTNYLRPDIKRGNFTKEEEDTIINLHQMLGNRWSAMAARLPGRTDNEIKNVWHTYLKKRLNQHNPSTATTQSNARSGNTTGYCRVPPHESSSSDMSSSSVTTFDINTNNSNDNNNNNSASMKIESSSSFENIGETIEDSFWSEVLSNDNFSESLMQLQIPSSALMGPVGLHSISSSSATMYDSHNNMDFWYNHFTRDGELPQIPDI